VHTYKVQAPAVFEMLDATNVSARSIGVRVLVGETRYHSSEQATIFRAWLSQHPDNVVIGISEWPLENPSTGCGIDVAPPYNPGVLATVGHDTQSP
jgi:hypothetical protein